MPWVVCRKGWVCSHLSWEPPLLCPEPRTTLVGTPGPSPQRRLGQEGREITSCEKQLRVCFARRVDSPSGEGGAALSPDRKGRLLCAGATAVSRQWVQKDPQQAVPLQGVPWARRHAPPQGPATPPLSRPRPCCCVWQRAPGEWVVLTTSLRAAFCLVIDVRALVLGFPGALVMLCSLEGADGAAGLPGGPGGARGAAASPASPTGPGPGMGAPRFPRG